MESRASSTDTALRCLQMLPGLDVQPEFSHAAITTRRDRKPDGRSPAASFWSRTCAIRQLIVGKLKWSRRALNC